jgi:Recombination endonuclease VII
MRKSLAEQIAERREVRRRPRFGDTHKVCTRCKADLLLCQYSQLENGALGLNPVCKVCRAEQSKDYARAKRDAEFPRQRPDLCECCGKPPRRLRLHWDRDRERGGIRGWLCNYCKQALSAVSDDVAHLEQLIAYVKRHGGPA